MSELSFDSVVVPEDKPQINRLTAGNHKVKVSKVEKTTNATAGTPALDITVEDESKAFCTNRYQLSTEEKVGKDGKPYSSWSITSLAIIYLVEAACGVDEAGAKAKLAGLSTENLDVKLSSILVGKPFSINLKGEHKANSDVTKDSWIKVEFGGWRFARTIEEFDKLPKTVFIKGLPIKGAISSPTTSGVIADGNDSWS